MTTLTVLSKDGSNDLGTMTRDELLAARELSDSVHVVVVTAPCVRSVGE